jgi:hypothetical protein
MNAQLQAPTIDTSRFARCIEAGKRIRRDTEDDVIHGRHFDFTQRFLPGGPALVEALGALTTPQQRLHFEHASTPLMS